MNKAKVRRLARKVERKLEQLEKAVDELMDVADPEPDESWQGKIKVNQGEAPDPAESSDLYMKDGIWYSRTTGKPVQSGSGLTTGG